MQRVVRKLPLHLANDMATGDLQYWLSQPMQARIAQVEVLRRQSPGYDAQQRLQRVCRVTQLKPDIAAEVADMPETRLLRPKQKTCAG